MLRRARQRARSRGVDNVEFIEADAGAIPMDSASVDLFLSFWGLHCFEDPESALLEASRLLKPGGRLVGASFVGARDSVRQRLLIRPGHGAFGRVGTQGEVEGWLGTAGLAPTQLQRSARCCTSRLQPRGLM
jgi:ubiquinone/menaquinone biosynthesis C-methylase UbiE